MTNIVVLTLGLTFEDHMFSYSMFLSKAQLLLISVSAVSSWQASSLGFKSGSRKKIST